MLKRAHLSAATAEYRCQVPQRVRKLIDYLAARIGEQAYWEKPPGSKDPQRPLQTVHALCDYLLANHCRIRKASETT